MKNVTIVFKEREADIDEIEKYLRQYDTEFTPVLALRVQIRQYAEKISQNACVCWMVWEHKKIGMCAIYMNQGRQAFITSINIAKKFCGQGMGSLLLETIVAEAKARGITQIALTVSRKNKSAISFYEKNDFIIQIKTDEWYQMIRWL